MEPSSIVAWSCNTCGATHEVAGLTTQKPQVCASCGGTSFTKDSTDSGGSRVRRLWNRVLGRDQ